MSEKKKFRALVVVINLDRASRNGNQRGEVARLLRRAAIDAESIGLTSFAIDPSDPEMGYTNITLMAAPEDNIQEKPSGAGRKAPAPSM